MSIDVALIREWIVDGVEVRVAGSQELVIYTSEADCTQAEAEVRALHIVALHNASLEAATTSYAEFLARRAFERKVQELAQ